MKIESEGSFTVKAVTSDLFPKKTVVKKTEKVLEEGVKKIL
jgi:hypothetical protein